MKVNWWLLEDYCYIDNYRVDKSVVFWCKYIWSLCNHGTNPTPTKVWKNLKSELWKHIDFKEGYWLMVKVWVTIQKWIFRKRVSQSVIYSHFLAWNNFKTFDITPLPWTKVSNSNFFSLVCIIPHAPLFGHVLKNLIL